MENRRQYESRGLCNELCGPVSAFRDIANGEVSRHRNVDEDAIDKIGDTDGWIITMNRCPFFAGSTA